MTFGKDLSAPSANYLTIERAFKTLEILGQHPGLSVTELSDRMNEGKSSVNRMLKTMVNLGYAYQAKNRGGYAIGPKTLLLSAGFMKENYIINTAKPHMEKLAFEGRGGVHLGLLMNHQVFVVSKIDSPEKIRLSSRVGVCLAPHASALGKVLLSKFPQELKGLKYPLTRFTPSTIVSKKEFLTELDQANKNNYALEVEEEHLGVGCIGAAIVDKKGKAVAGISLSGPVNGTPFSLNEKHIEMVLETAKKISEVLPEEIS